MPNGRTVIQLKTGAWGSLTILLLGLLAADGWLTATQHWGLRVSWVATVAILLALCIVAGLLVNGMSDGILVDDRNRMSLERFQWTAWLIVLLAGFFAESAWNIGQGGGFPVMQAELWALLGIVSASPVVSNIIVDNKKRDPSGAAPEQAKHALAMGDHPLTIGSVDANRSPREASWADLYLGEEAANRYVVDISRLQKLIVTVLLVLAYIAMLWHDLGAKHGGVFDSMPILGNKGGDGATSFLWLLGISHASYLAYKATPKKPS